MTVCKNEQQQQQLQNAIVEMNNAQNQHKNAIKDRAHGYVKKMQYNECQMQIPTHNFENHINKSLKIQQIVKITSKNHKKTMPK